MHCVCRRAQYALACLALAGCRWGQPSTSGQSVPKPSNVTTIIREVSFEDEALAARNQGRLDVVVRSTDRPTQFLPDAAVQLSLSAGATLRLMTDQNGLASFDSLPAGIAELTVRRVGYSTARATVTTKPGCRTDAEAYVSLAPVGIAPPPPMPGRVVLTTCR